VNRIFKTILFFLVFFSYTFVAGGKEKSISNKEDNCFIYYKLEGQKQFNKIDCTDKNKYPTPNLGFDKNHCVLLRSNIFFNLKSKLQKKGNGLYCSMDGYSNRAYWYYVQ
jgi:hypothetical protein